MKSKKINLIILSALIVVSVALLGGPALAQNAPVKTNSKILYHDGAVMQNGSNVYFIWYGNWVGNTAPTILTDFAAILGSSPYFKINKLYPDLNGGAPNGALIYSGRVYDAYSHGSTLTVSDIQAIVADHIAAGRLPLDGAGIYIVIASADVTDIYPLPDGSWTTFCTPNTFPHHGMLILNGAQMKYGFLGNAARCPSVLVPQSPSPNGDIYADAMASTLAHLLDVIVTSPWGNGGALGGWYDRYGLENAQKCQGTYGQTYTAPNGARANIHLGARDYLIQQNWVNIRRGYCGLSSPVN